jgi:hypothetical protein
MKCKTNNLKRTTTRKIETVVRSVIVSLHFMQYNCVFQTNYWDCKQSTQYVITLVGNCVDVVVVVVVTVKQKVLRDSDHGFEIARQWNSLFIILCIDQVLELSVIEVSVALIAGKAASQETKARQTLFDSMSWQNQMNEYHDIFLIWSTTNENTIIINYYFYYYFWINLGPSFVYSFCK